MTNKKAFCKMSTSWYWTPPSPKPCILAFPHCRFGAVSQSYLRCCLPGCSPHFAPNKTSLTTLKLCIFFSPHLWAAKELGKNDRAFTPREGPPNNSCWVKDTAWLVRWWGPCHWRYENWCACPSVRNCGMSRPRKQFWDFRVVYGLRQGGQFLN